MEDSAILNSPFPIAGTTFLPHIWNMEVAPNFSDLKNEAMKMLAALEDAEILARVRAILSESQTLSGEDWWDSLPAEHQSRITQGIADIEAGRVIPHSEVLKRMEQWRKR